MAREDRRASIVEAAMEIILRDGLGAATVRKVAAAIDASPGHIHRHFASADELRAEAFRTLWAGLMPRILEQLGGLSPRDKLIAVLVGEYDGMEAATERLWREALLAMREEPNVHAAVREEMEKWLSLLVEIVEAGRASGAFPAGLPAGEVARRLVALCVGIDVMAGFGLPGHSKDDVRERIDACIDALLGAASR